MEPGLLKQGKVFLDSEGDAWFNRNFHKMERDDDPIVEMIRGLPIHGDILEYGCSNGWRLNKINQITHRPCYGLDPSIVAIENGRLRFPSKTLVLDVGAAGGKNDHYAGCAVVIYGFCLYLCERKDLAEIVARGDHALYNGGHLIIQDFDPEYPHCVPYKHFEGAYSYKMDYSKLWLANPAYTLVEKRVLPDGVAIWLLKKDLVAGWPVEELR